MKDNISSSPILNIVSRILFAPIIIFGLYVQFHGDYGPGGGFQAGVIIAAAFILYSMIFGIKKGETLVPVKICLLYTSPSPRDGLLSRMPSSA